MRVDRGDAESPARGVERHSGPDHTEAHHEHINDLAGRQRREVSRAPVDVENGIHTAKLVMM
jgi:hypothetical protein